MSLRDHARYPNVNVHHDDHWNEKGTHRGENNVSSVLVVTARLVLVSSLFVPTEKKVSLPCLHGIAYGLTMTHLLTRKVKCRVIDTEGLGLQSIIM